MEFSSDEEFQEYCQSTGRTYVMFLIASKGEHQEYHTLTLELYTDTCPDTCKNFLSLVEGKGQGHLGYKVLAHPANSLPAC